MLCLGLLLTVVLSPYSLAEMQDPEAIPLYPGKAPGSESWTQVEIEQQWGDQRIVRNVVQPALLPYLAEPDINTGQAVIVAPGGGFKFLSIDSNAMKRAGMVSVCASRICWWTTGLWGFTTG